MRFRGTLIALVLVCGACRLAAQDCPHVAAGDWDVAPCMRDSVRAAYPYMARLAAVEGTVELRVLVLASGDPCNVSVVAGPVPLHAPAVEAAMKSRYTAATKCGLPVPGVIELSYPFRLSDPMYERPDWPPPDLRRPRLSEVSPAKRVTADSGVEFEEFQYSNVRIWGDMSVALCDSVLAVIGARLKPGERITLMTHYLALPRDWDPNYKWTWLDIGDLTVDVAGAPDSNGVIRRQRGYRFFERSGTYELSDVESLYMLD